MLPGVEPVPVPTEALRVLGWNETQHVPGAYPVRVEVPPAPGRATKPR
jgi:hypothetical protein